MGDQIWIRGFVGAALCLLCSCAPFGSERDAAPPPRTQLLGVEGPPIELVGFELPRESGRSTGYHFFIGKYEVTNRQYQTFARDSGYSGADHSSSKGTESFLHHFTGGQFPEGQGEYPDYAQYRCGQHRL